MEAKYELKFLGVKPRNVEQKQEFVNLNDHIDVLHLTHPLSSEHLPIRCSLLKGWVKC